MQFKRGASWHVWPLACLDARGQLCAALTPEQPPMGWSSYALCAGLVLCVAAGAVALPNPLDCGSAGTRGVTNATLAAARAEALAHVAKLAPRLDGVAVEGLRQVRC